MFLLQVFTDTPAPWCLQDGSQGLSAPCDRSYTLTVQDRNQMVSTPKVLLSVVLFHTLYFKYSSDWLMNSDLEKKLNIFHNCTSHT